MTFSIVKHPTIDDPYPSVFQLRLLNSERLPSQMREEVQTGMVLVDAWDRWFREHRGLYLVLESDISMMDMAERPQANQVDRTQSPLQSIKP